jgi:alginate O-acetyltransferase complex protein AlgI
MLFNSIDFAIFFPLFFLLYWFVFQRNLSGQNALILVASFIFYGWWDWRFLFLLVFSSGIDFVAGYHMSNSSDPKRRKVLLLISLITNLGILGFFKYYNFFVDNFVDAFRLFGLTLNVTTLKIILPVGISFYTFQSLSYTIDIYRGKLSAIKDPVVYFAFISFFPQLVAGPIERATNLVPQVMQPRVFDYNQVRDGLRQVLWGLFKKIVVADNCATFVNLIFEHHSQYNGISIAIGVAMFAFQIYCDFSGYSDIAIGTAHMLGFNLMRNFHYPYFSRDVAEFWRRWHISLTTWFRDYVYIPLGGSKGSQWQSLRNTMFVFLISGFWHGANWTFIIWGALNAIFYVPLFLTGAHRRNIEIVAYSRALPSIKELLQMLLTFLLICITWIFFRSRSVDEAFGIFRHFNPQKFAAGQTVDLPGLSFVMVTILLLVEWIQRRNRHGLYFDDYRLKTALRWTIYIAIVLVIFLFRGDQQKFIYFDF